MSKKKSKELLSQSEDTPVSHHKILWLESAMQEAGSMEVLSLYAKQWGVNIGPDNFIYAEQAPNSVPQMLHLLRTSTAAYIHDADLENFSTIAAYIEIENPEYAKRLVILAKRIVAPEQSQVLLKLKELGAQLEFVRTGFNVTEIGKKLLGIDSQTR